MGVPGKQHNILQSNIYILLRSGEMVAQYLLIAIVYLTCMLSLQWFDGKTQTIWKYNWGARSMGRALYLFLTKLLQLHKTPRLFLSDMFMIMIFHRIGI